MGRVQSGEKVAPGRFNLPPTIPADRAADLVQDFQAVVLHPAVAGAEIKPQHQKP